VGVELFWSAWFLWVLDKENALNIFCLIKGCLIKLISIVGWIGWVEWVGLDEWSGLLSWEVFWSAWVFCVYKSIW
jgi:hypothetical protein